jgi:hypothetical protein
MASKMTLRLAKPLFLEPLAIKFGRCLILILQNTLAATLPRAVENLIFSHLVKPSFREYI